MIHYGIRRLCLAAALSVLCLIGPWAQAQSFSIGSNGFSATNVCSSAYVTQGCQVATNGNAAEVPAGENTPSLLRITPALANQTGSAWYVSTQPFASGFDTQFQFQLNGGAGGADGIAFVIQSAGLSAIGFTGGNGGAMGYGDDDADQFPMSGIAGSVAFEFDTYKNPWDPDANHVAIQSCGPNPNTSHHNVNCPSNTEFGNSTIRLASTDIPLTGNPHLAEIKYVVTPPPVGCEVECVTTRILTISIDGNQVLSANVDLTTFLGPGPAYVGFTGGTGALNNNQDILSWSYLGTQQSAPQTTGSNTTNTFTFNPSPLVQHTLAFPVDAIFPEGIVPPVTIQSANNLISDIRCAGKIRTHVSHDIRRDAFEQLQELSFQFLRHEVGRVAHGTADVGLSAAFEYSGLGRDGLHLGHGSDGRHQRGDGRLQLAACAGGARRRARVAWQ